MTTSGSVSFTQNRNEIITTALDLLNVYSSADTIAPTDIQFCSRMLNMMVSAWQAQGIHLWKKKEATLFLQLGQSSFNLGSIGDNATSDNYISATIGANAIATQTTLTLADTTGMAANDYIGIVLNNGYFQWTTIESVVNATTITIPSPGLTSATIQGNIVYSYTTKINRPLRVPSCRRNSNINQDTPMFLYSYDEYFALPNKTSTGAPTTFTYQPDLGNGILYIWPVVNNVTDYRVKFTYFSPIEDFTSALNTADFPQEWLETLTFQLAVRISHKYGRRRMAADLKNDADIMLQNLLQWDNEPASIYFQPDPY